MRVKYTDIDLEDMERTMLKLISELEELSAKTNMDDAKIILSSINASTWGVIACLRELMNANSHNKYEPMFYTNMLLIILFVLHIIGVL